MGNSEYNKYSVLFVDDEKNLLTSIKRGLLNQRYNKLFANSGQEAIEILENNDNNIAVLVTDLRMPDMSGMELLDIVQEKFPDIISIVLTGYSQVSTILAAVNNRTIYRYLTKPWKMDEEFIPAIIQALDFYISQSERKSAENKIDEIILLKKELEVKHEERNIVLNRLTEKMLSSIKNIIDKNNRLNKIKSTEILEISENIKRDINSIIDDINFISKKLNNDENE